MESKPTTIEINGDRSINSTTDAPGQTTQTPNTENDKEDAANFANLVRIYKYGSTFDAFLVALCTAGSICAGIAMPLMFLILGRIVGDLTSYFTPFSTVTKEQFMHGIQKNALIMVQLAVARFLLAYISMITIRIAGLRISARLRRSYIKAIFQLPVTQIDEMSPGAIASRLTTNSNIIESGISQQYFLAVQSTSFTIGLFVVAFTKNAKLTAISLVVIPVVLLVYGLTVPLLNRLWYQAEAHKDRASSLSYEVIQSIRIVVAFGAQDRLASEHQKIMDFSRAIDRKQAPIHGAMLSPMFLAIYGIFALTFWFGIRLYTRGKIHNVGNIIVVLFCVMYAVMSIYHLYNPLVQIGRAASASTKIFAVIDAENNYKIDLKSSGVSVSSDDIVFRDVTFAYPTRPDTIILNQLNLRFEKGKTTAIVGPSGSGKSTIVGLIEKWYRPTNGEPLKSSIEVESPIDTKKSETVTTKEFSSSGVFIGDSNLETLDTKWWRSQIGLVSQEPFLFNDTIFSNVANGLAGTESEGLSAERKRQMVTNACREAQANEFIDRLPLGYETLVGEGGLKLSGGQRQRIAIARAIIKDPAILILDEATSAIDVRTERLVQDVLDKVSKSRTTITIAHRLSTIKKADKIIVLRSGKVVEQGVHEELLAQEGGLYAALVKAQVVEIGIETDHSDSDSIKPVEKRVSASTSVYDNVENATALPVQVVHADKTKTDGPMKNWTTLVREQRSRWPQYAMMIVSGVIGSATYPIQAYLFAKVIDAFKLPNQQLLQRGNFLAMMFCVQAVSVAFAFLILGWSAAIIAADVSTNYRQEYIENVMKQEISFFDDDKNSPGTLTSRVSRDPTRVKELLGGEMALQLVAVSGILGSVIIALCFGWKLSLVGVFAIMPVSMAAGYYRVHLERYFEQLNAEVFAETAQFGSEAIGAFRTVTALGMEDTIIKRFDQLLSLHMKKAIKQARLSTIVFAFSESADMFCQPLFFWYGGRLLASREYDIVHFFVIYMAVVQSSISLGMFFSFAPNIAEAAAAASRIIGIRPLETLRKLPNMPFSQGTGGIEFKNVHFTYKERDTPVLRGVDIKISPGQFAAFVGPSGSGKSTLISLLERFYDPSRGQILLDGCDITQFDAASYRENLSLVAQESTLYEGTIRDNISLSVSKSMATDSAIEAACRAAQIHTFIVSLPDGYATHIGSKGIALSGGQRQRLALARALLRKPKVLLLDEATSNLDSESESQVQKAIESVAGGRTVIAVAHRLSTVRKADVIFVLGSGCILEYGNHSSLLARRGMYYQMCQAQALDR